MEILRKMSAMGVKGSGGGRVDSLRDQQFIELQDENMPPKFSGELSVEGMRRFSAMEGPLQAKVKSLLNSKTASGRLKAIRAINSPGEMDKITSFDVPYVSQEIVTEEERRQAKEAQNRTIQEVMADVCVYVEVRSGREDRSESIKQVIAGLGAQVNDRFLRNTTHVIFKEGLLSTYNKAKKWNIPLVSILWIEACRKCVALVDPERYLPSDLECYENPELFKIKRYKYIREVESPMKLSSKSLQAAPNSPQVITPKILSKTAAHLLKDDSAKSCDTPETQFINNILVAREGKEKTEIHNEATEVSTPVQKSLILPDSAPGNTPNPEKTLRRSTRRASFTNVSALQEAESATKPFKSLRKSSSMDLTLPSSLEVNFPKLDNITEEEDGEDMEMTKVVKPTNRFTIYSHDTMVESPANMTDEVVIVDDDSPKRWTQINGVSDMEIIKDEETPERLKFCSTVTPGSSRRQTMFHIRMQMINKSARAEKETSQQQPDKTAEFENLLTPSAPATSSAAKPRRRTLCPMPTSVKIFERKTTSKDRKQKDQDKIQSQAKRRKLFHHTTTDKLTEVPKAATPTTVVKKTTNNATKLAATVAKNKDTRRSTLEFEDDTTKESDGKQLQKKARILVITNLYGKDKQIVEETVRKLGGFHIERTVTRATSHLVCLNPARTLNMMRALIRGVWILNLDWVKQSAVANRWIPEEAFELHQFAPGVRVNRLERQLLGNGFKMNLLQSFSSPLYVSPKCSVPLKEMQELIVLCGGRVATRSQATFVICSSVADRRPEVTYIHSNWLLDSVMANKLLPTTKYII